MQIVVSSFGMAGVVEGPGTKFQQIQVCGTRMTANYLRSNPTPRSAGPMPLVFVAVYAVQSIGGVVAAILLWPLNQLLIVSIPLVLILSFFIAGPVALWITVRLDGRAPQLRLARRLYVMNRDSGGKRRPTATARSRGHASRHDERAKAA